MDKNDMVTTYVFDTAKLKIGGMYRVSYVRTPFDGVLTEMSPNTLTFYYPIKDRESKCHLEPIFVDATDFCEKEDASITELT